MSSLHKLSNLPDQSEQTIRISDSDIRLYREARRVLSPNGRLFFFDQGWYLRIRNILKRTGFNNFKAYRLARNGRYLLELESAQSHKSFFPERILRSPPSILLLKLLPGHYFYSASMKDGYSDEMFMRLNRRTIFSALTKKGYKEPHMFIKAARPMARGDFPLKERFIIHWIRSQQKGINLPDIYFDSSNPSLLFIKACPGFPLSLTLNDLKRPDEETKQKVAVIRRAIEDLSTTTPPVLVKCETFLEMVCNEALQIRKEMFEHLAFDDAQCIVHGDLNPSNIIMYKNKIFIIDWEHWRIGKRFENWFDFVIRSIWIAIRRRKRNTPGYILDQYKTLLMIPWIEEETDTFFKNCEIKDDANMCLRYSLFLFLIDQIIDIDPARLKKELDKIKLFNSA